MNDSSKIIEGMSDKKLLLWHKNCWGVRRMEPPGLGIIEVEAEILRRMARTKEYDGEPITSQDEATEMTGERITKIRESNAQYISNDEREE